ncbi:MAG: hypothetical protein HYT80_05450 [Euryarchaeota archaeon]|nr:hypothetical protein [Euryarchaeota archaeon]
MLGPFLPMHHGGASDPDANLAQKFIDSDPGVVLASFLHTTGALLFTAGIILYVYQARLLDAAKKASHAPSLKVLPIAHGLNLLGIAFNGMGGLMRLYQSDHPRIDELGTNTWVQLLFVKHLFLVLGVGLAVFLTFRTHVLSIADDAPKTLFPETRRIQLLAIGSFGTILLASILGAAAANSFVPPAGTGAQTDTGGDDHAVHGTATFFRYANTTGTIGGTVVAPARETVTLDVPPMGFELWADLRWDTQNTALRLEVKNPEGQDVQGTRTPGTQRLQFKLAESLKEGAWRFVVVGETPVEIPYQLTTRVAYGEAAGIFEQTTVIAGKGATATRNPFSEIDLKMKLGEGFAYSWEVVDSGSAVSFNIHLHFGSEVVYPVKGEWKSYSGHWSHNETRTDGVSLMWENASPNPVKVHFRLVGNFTVENAPRT